VTLPAGFRLRPDERTRRYDDGRLLVGGAPRRVLRLTSRGADVARRLFAGEPVAGGGDAALARRLLDAGIAHPVPADTDVTVEVVIPVYDDTAALHLCLSSLENEVTVTVVDDGSTRPRDVAGVAARHGARLVRRPDNAGPAAARNAGVAHCSADVVAFVDSDAVIDVTTLRRVVAHFSDPLVVAAAPRVRAIDTGRGVLGVIARHWSPLDLGPSAGPVLPNGRIAYVPSTVLLVRRGAFAAAGGFDESLRYGEDVDLVWRLVAAGGRVRYDPTAVVRHAEPATWSAWLRRRFTYGTSAAPLNGRHADSAAPLLAAPAPLATVALAAAGAPRLGGAVAAVTALRLRRRLRAADVPAADATRAALVAPVQTALGAARWATQLWWPALLVAASRSRRSRPVVVASVLAPPLVEWAKRRPVVDPVRWTLAVWADDVAYGLGVWTGCLRGRTMRPLLPRVTVPRRESD
jgi:mycofactocin glycosyltransferase